MADPYRGGSDAAQRIARRVTEGVSALREGRAAEAADLLEVCMDAEWVAATDTADLRCRALSLSAQALWQAGRADAALRRIDAALALARALGDLEGLNEIGELQARIQASARPPPASARSWAAGAEAELQAATAALEREDFTSAGELAARAVAAAGRYDPATGTLPRDVRVAVLARVLAVRADPSRGAAWLHEAAEIARDAEQATLLGAVARAAGSLGVDLGTLRGPEPVTERRAR